MEKYDTDYGHDPILEKWEANYEDNIIIVENRITYEQVYVRLYANGELQDERTGLNFGVRIWGIRLFGQLPTGGNIKAYIGTWWTMQCKIFIDHEQINTKRIV